MESRDEIQGSNGPSGVGDGEALAFEILSTLSVDDILHARDQINDILAQCATWASLQYAIKDEHWTDHHIANNEKRLRGTITADLRLMRSYNHARKVLQVLQLRPQGELLDGLDPNVWLKSQIRSGWGN